MIIWVGEGATVGGAVTVCVGLGEAITVSVGDALGEVTGAGLMVRVNVLDTDVPAVAVTVTEKEPAVVFEVSVPLIVPPALIESSAGSPLAVHVTVPVPPVAARLAL